MERLQAAIDKARRSQRPRLEAPIVSSQDDTSFMEMQAAWQDLPEVQLRQRTLQRNRIVTTEATPAATAFDILRTRTLRQIQEHGWRRVAVTSPTPNCGKSTVVLNLAFSIARQSNVRTIEIEMDMRRPSQSGILGLSGQQNRRKSIDQFLVGEASFSEIGIRYGDRLGLLTSNTPVSNASDILLGEEVATALHAVEQTYDPQIVLFDMPPLFANDDVTAFLRHVDCVLIVAGAETTTIAEIDRCERELANQTNVLGVVLNKCHFSASEKMGYGEWVY